MPGLPARAVPLVTWAASAVLVAMLVATWASRLTYPYDLEWMEGGMLAHAWRMRQELPVYPEPTPDWTPFIYPPGYSAILAGLGSLFPLHPALGRAVSLLGTALACGSLAHALRRRGATPVLVFGLVACFLGTYPASGAFLDLVRPDGVYLGLIGLTVALALDGRRGTAAASGLVLAAAFLVKHNAAAFGLPLLVGLALRNRRDAVAFAAASVLPALGMLGFLQWRTGGTFLVYLLEVPASHPSVYGRFFPGTPFELGSALGVMTAAAAIGCTLDVVRRGALPSVAVVGPVLLGMLAITVSDFVPFEGGVHPLPAGLAMFGVGALFGWLALRLAVLRRLPLDADDALVGGVLLMAFLLAGVMRAHNGGYYNVHLHLYWAGTLAFGWVATRADGGWFRWAVPAQVVAAIVALWGADLRPTSEARQAGDRLVAALSEVEGPVLSPFAAWLPTYAGHPPSVHYMALWDLDYRAGPWHGRLDDVRDAVRTHHWPHAVRSTEGFPYGLGAAYRQKGELDLGRALAPKSGWSAAPKAILEPKP